MASILASSGADLDTETKAGYTPLHVASHFGSVNMVKFLLDQPEEQKVRVDVQNELGYTPLHQAAQQGHSQIVNLLLEKNASPNFVSNVIIPLHISDIRNRGIGYKAICHKAIYRYEAIVHFIRYPFYTARSYDFAPLYRTGRPLFRSRSVSATSASWRRSKW